VESKDGGEIMRDAVLLGLEQAYNNFAGMLADFLPRFLVVLIVMAIGLLVAFALKYVLRAILGFTNLDRSSAEMGASRVLQSAHLPAMTVLLSRALFWVTWFSFILIALSTLGLSGFRDEVLRIFHYLPQLFVGILIVFIGLMAANFMSRTVLLAAVNAGHPSARIFSWLIRFLIWILTISMTLEELGVAEKTVVSVFSIVFGALMLGLAIAFGLGGQEMARKSLERYLGSNRKESDKEPNPL
jgi:small-conductance mechanosensitive channel